MIIIVDSNILISSLINSSGKEFSILKKDYKQIDFVSSTFLIEEFSKKINKVASFTSSPVEDLFFQFTSLVDSFILVDEKELDIFTRAKAETLIKGLDSKDFLYVALTIYFDGLLWTGDLKLKKGLNKKQFMNVITTKELSQIIKGL